MFLISSGNSSHEVACFSVERTKYLILEVSVLHYNDNAPLIDTIMGKVREYSFKIEDILDYKYLNNQVFQMDFLLKNTYLYD